MLDESASNESLRADGVVVTDNDAVAKILLALETCVDNENLYGGQVSQFQLASRTTIAVPDSIHIDADYANCSVTDESRSSPMTSPSSPSSPSPFVPLSITRTNSFSDRSAQGIFRAPSPSSSPKTAVLLPTPSELARLKSDLGPIFPPKFANNHTNLLCNTDSERDQLGISTGEGDTWGAESTVRRSSDLTSPHNNYDYLSASSQPSKKSFQTTPIRSGNNARYNNIIINNNNNSMSNKHTNKHSNISSKRKKIKPSSRKNNLVILPWNGHPIHRSKSDSYPLTLSQFPLQNASPQRQQKNSIKSPCSSSNSSKLPPPHPFSHVQSYPPSHPQHVSPHHQYSPHHAHSHSFASDASSSEATPITSPARRSHAYSFSSVDTGDLPLLSDDLLTATADHIHSFDTSGECTRENRDNYTSDGEFYFEDFDDSLSRDSLLGEGISREGDLSGVNYHLDSSHKCSTPIVDIVPSSISSSSLLGLIIPMQHPQHHHHIHRSISNPSLPCSLQCSPSTMASYAEANTIPFPKLPSMPKIEHRVNEYGELDDSSLFNTTSCSSTDISPPSSPNHPLRPTFGFETPQPTKHPFLMPQQQQINRISPSESFHRSTYSDAQFESTDILQNSNPDALYFGESFVAGSTVALPTSMPVAFTSPQDSIYSEETHSLCEEAKLFVQQIHNSGLETLSFEHVEDTLENTSMDVEIELVYNNGSFDEGSSVGGDSSVGSTQGSVMSMGERDKLKRTLQCFRQFRSAQRKNSRMEGRLVPLRDAYSGSDIQVDNKIINHGFKESSTPVASNKGSLSVQPKTWEEKFEEFHPKCDTQKSIESIFVTTFSEIGDNLQDSSCRKSNEAHCDGCRINEFQEDDFESIELAPLAPSKNSAMLLQDNTNMQYGANHYNCYSEGKYYPQNLYGWRSFFQMSNLSRWLRSQPSRYLTAPLDSGNKQRKDKVSNNDYTYKGFDDVDFDRKSSNICFYCLFCCNKRERDLSISGMQTGWSKLIIISCLLLLAGWMISDDGLKKHHSQQPRSELFGTKYGYYRYDHNDPLAKEQFIEGNRTIDDADDFDGHTVNNAVLRREDDDIDLSFVKQYYGDQDQQTVIPQQLVAQADDVYRHFEMEDDLFDIPESSGSYTTTPLRDNENHIPSILPDINTIVVLGERHVGIQWLVDKLKVLYPTVAVSSGFPSKKAREGIWFQNSDAERRLQSQVMSNDTYYLNEMYSPHVLQNFSRPHSRSTPTSNSTPSKKILVIALFVNPYDWIELMRLDPINASHHEGMQWLEFVQTEWSPKKSLLETSDESYYELNIDGSGNFYDSILQLRADKIRSAVKGSLYHHGVVHVIPIQYEDLLKPYKNEVNNIHNLSNHSFVELPGIRRLVDQIKASTRLNSETEVNNSFWPYPIGCSGLICYPSIETMRSNADYIKYINENVDWHAEQLMGYQKWSLPKPSVDQIVVLGERHTRAEWLVNCLSRCFPDTEVRYGFSRPGKYFQISPPEQVQKTLVIALFLHPYDWVELMRQDPVDAPAHSQMEWLDFVTTPWERRRSNLDNSIPETSFDNCSFGFSFHEIIPCHTQRSPESKSFPLYELRHYLDHFNVDIDDPYASLVELRADKITNFLSTVHYSGVVNLIKVRYEDLVWDDTSSTDENTSYISLPFPGIAGLLETIRDHTSLVPDAAAGWINDENGIFRAEPLSVGLSNLDPNYVKWMKNHVDWNVEKLVGYGP